MNKNIRQTAATVPEAVTGKLVKSQHHKLNSRIVHSYCKKLIHIGAIPAKYNREPHIITAPGTYFLRLLQDIFFQQ